MKKPESKTTSSKGPNASNGESGTDSEKLKIKMIEHGAGVAKSVIATSGKLADWGKQATATKAALRESDVKIRAAEEKTKQVVANAITEMDKTQMLREQNANSHTQEMAKLQSDYERMKTQDQERKRVLDKLLDEPVSPDQLAQSFIALIPPPKR